ncbi:N-(5'-phosphoribosyl)anthranilate isomerase [Luteitalea sp. TBR-22]|uniref:phosphoribosylanthranilate isomerase n=1 Tax=Luteitalea sp. TBR-22 TaxID=2802971 RepID=UPI001AF2DD65|nr:phosphoribosylanthranilate isomerase [Luteitalea sp. TBR-22]BCS33609.1 N-(5'-phosphoribosyl)anthranilate isomerase [Luteitalea sp. TBR-22]
MTRIKICGITSVDDALLALDAGADAIGLIFWPGSRRAVDVERARAITRVVPPLVATVGVFVDETPDQVRSIADAVGLSAVQLHGQETPLDWARFPRPVLKAMPVEAYADSPWQQARAAILVDAHDPVTIGGTGRTVDWEAARAIAATRRLVLAGGLTPDNVGDAVRMVRPWGVDVASGVEQAPGVKDPGKVRAFVQAVREAR